MQHLEDLIPDVTQCATVKAFFEARLKMLYVEQSDVDNEWNDAIDSAIRLVVRS